MPSYHVPLRARKWFSLVFLIFTNCKVYSFLLFVLISLYGRIYKKDLQIHPYLDSLIGPFELLSMHNPSLYLRRYYCKGSIKLISYQYIQSVLLVFPNSILFDLTHFRPAY